MKLSLLSLSLLSIVTSGSVSVVNCHHSPMRCKLPNYFATEWKIFAPRLLVTLTQM